MSTNFENFEQKSTDQLCEQGSRRYHPAPLTSYLYIIPIAPTTAPARASIPPTSNLLPVPVFDGVAALALPLMVPLAAGVDSPVPFALAALPV